MKTIKITRTYDEHDCDDCGYSTAEGAKIYINGRKVLDLKPVAHCYEGKTYSDIDILKAVLEYLDFETRILEVTYEA